MDPILVFPLSQWYLDNLLNDSLGFTCDGEGGMTSCRRIGELGILTVGGMQVDGQATVIAEAFEAAMLPLLLGELAICPNTRLV